MIEIKPIPSDKELRIYMLKYFLSNGFCRTTMDYAQAWCIENLPLSPLTREGIRAEKEYTPKLMAMAEEVRKLRFTEAREILKREA